MTALLSPIELELLRDGVLYGRLAKVARDHHVSTGTIDKARRSAEMKLERFSRPPYLPKPDDLLENFDDLQYRAQFTLSGNGIKTVGDLLKQTEASLLHLKGFSRGSLKKVRAWLVDHNLSIGTGQYIQIREDELTMLHKRETRLLGTIKSLAMKLRSTRELIAIAKRAAEGKTP
jgi:hypothetical protein